MRIYPAGKLSSLAVIGLLLLAAAALQSCQPRNPVIEEQFIAFGSLVEIKLYGVKPEVAQQAIRAVEKDFQYLHQAWHAWEPGPITRMNQLIASGETFTVAPSTLPLLQRSIALALSSEGLFNPAIGSLLRLWGFQGSEVPSGPPPSAADIKTLVDRAPSMADLELNGITLHSRNPAVRLDFGAIAQGLSLDYAIARLKEFGIENAVVNVSGDLRAIGRHGDRAWRVGIRNPADSGILAAIDVQGDATVITSGDYERFFDYEGKHYCHIIDPRTGYPAQGTASVTVLDSDAGRADAASTALLIAGPKDWYRIAKKMGVEGVLLVDKSGVVYMTPNLRERVYFHVEPKPTIIYSDPL